MNNIDFETLYKKIPFKDENTLKNIEKAYKFALEAHMGEKRNNGSDYITHPLNVTNILLDLNVDETTIICSLLHEVLNHDKSLKKDIADNFGVEVANIIDSLSKIQKLKLADDQESSAIYFRKVLVGLSFDPRILFIKLADRLENMRLIDTEPFEYQKLKAKETMNVLVPIAHRLGINSIKSELENICLKILKPEVYEDILKKLNKTTTELNENLLEMKISLSNLLNENNIKHEIKGRVKSVYSIYNKLSSGRKWNDIYDILALRIFVNTEVECYTTIGLIHSIYRPIPKRFKDYIANPKENMYQSLHTTVFGPEGMVYEIQVRTYEMDEIAEKGLASHWSYKEKGTKKVQAVMEQKLELFRNMIESNSDKDDATFESELNSEFLSELIYVFTPKGDVIELPKGATPIDFAYRIHSKVGDATSGAIVNDNIVPLSYELDNNDICKIITSSSATPNKDWLQIAKTSQARSKIKSYFSKIDHEELIDKGRIIFEKELRKRKLSINEVLKDNNLNKILKDLKLDDLDDLYASIGSMRYTVGYIINLTNFDKHDLNDTFIEKKKPLIKNDHSNNEVLIDGNTNILYNLSKCCKPVKGDDIIGIITKGEGVSIHKKDCQNIINNEDRLVMVSWNLESTGLYSATIKITLLSNKSIMEIVALATKEKIQIIDMHNENEDNFIICNLLVKVKNREELERFKNKIMRFKNVKVD